MSRTVVEAGTLEPLEAETPEEGAASDHRAAYCRLDLERREAFRWDTYTYRHMNDVQFKRVDGYAQLGRGHRGRRK